MVRLNYKDKKSDSTVGSTTENNNQNKNLYKLEIHKVMGKEMLNKKYKDDRQGLHSLHCDIISFAKSNNIPMKYSDILLDKTDNLNPGDYEVLRIAEFMVRISRTLRALTAKEVVAQIKKAETNRQEWNGRIYEDNCWWADVERHPYG